VFIRFVGVDLHSSQINFNSRCVVSNSAFGPNGALSTVLTVGWFHIFLFFPGACRPVGINTFVV
jgi:hypothetical protein